MFAGCFITIIATFMQAFTPRHNIGLFIAGRVIIGIGQGLALTAAPVYIGEVTPAAIRGKVMTIWQMNYSTGSFIAYWTNFACSKYRSRLGEWDWRIVVLFQILVPLIVCSTVIFIPETPRWFIQKRGDVDGARAALIKIRPAEEVEEELASIRSAIEFEKELIKGSSYAALFRDASVRKRLYLAFVLNIGQQLTGQGTLNSYSTTIYRKVWPDSGTINLINALNATFGILFTLNAMWTSDRYGRRWLLMVGASGMGLCMLIVSTVGLTTPTFENGTKSESVGISIVFLFFLFAFFYKPSWGATVWMWTAEVFSMNVRAQAVGMCSQMQNVSTPSFSRLSWSTIRTSRLTPARSPTPSFSSSSPSSSPRPASSASTSSCRSTSSSRPSSTSSSPRRSRCPSRRSTCSSVVPCIRSTVARSWPSVPTRGRSRTSSSRSSPRTRSRLVTKG